MVVLFETFKKLPVKSFCFLQNSTELPNLIEDHIAFRGSEYFVDSDTVSSSLHSWLGTDEANSTLPPYDHVMLLTKYVIELFYI